MAQVPSASRLFPDLVIVLEGSVKWPEDTIFYTYFLRHINHAHCLGRTEKHTLANELGPLPIEPIHVHKCMLKMIMPDTLVNG